MARPNRQKSPKSQSADAGPSIACNGDAAVSSDWQRPSWDYGSIAAADAGSERRPPARDLPPHPLPRRPHRRLRRLITDPPIFIRRYRSHHPPLLLGFLNPNAPKRFYPVKAPHNNAPAACAVANISIDYLPPDRKHNNWWHADVRDGRVLLKSFSCFLLPDIAVCDPLSRRYLMLPRVPREGGELLKDCCAVFAPCADKKDETTFKVICMAVYRTGFVVQVFDSGCSSWNFRAHSRWDALSLGKRSFLWYSSSAYGCFYWKVYRSNTLLKLDVSRMEISTVVLPPGHETRQLAVVEVGEDKLGMFCYSHKVLTYYHYNGKIGDEWQMENVIPLPAHDNFLMLQAFQGYIFLQLGMELKDSTYRCYSLDIKTLEFECVTQMICGPSRILPYFVSRHHCPQD